MSFPIVPAVGAMIREAGARLLPPADVRGPSDQPVFLSGVGRLMGLAPVPAANRRVLAGRGGLRGIAR